MFNRTILKSRAKMVLSLNYWPIFLALFLASAITSFISMPISAISYRIDDSAQMVLISGVMITTVILSYALTVFVIGPINVGVKRFLLNTALENKADISDLFYAFKNGYQSVATTTLMKNLILFAYALLAIVIVFIGVIIISLTFGLNGYMPFGGIILYLLLIVVSLIPYIIKEYDYYLTDYILAENPNMEWREVLKTSKTMMRGNRFATFILQLSFIGWILLGVLAFFVGVVFVEPYIMATETQLYLELSGKNKADTEEETVEI